jgi:hypothetical protein
MQNCICKYAHLIHRIETTINYMMSTSTIITNNRNVPGTDSGYDFSSNRVNTNNTSINLLENGFYTFLLLATLFILLMKIKEMARNNKNSS